MPDLPAFHTNAFGRAAQLLEEEIGRIKDEAVASLVEAPHAHPYRLGRIQGLVRAAELMSQIDKAIAGVDQTPKRRTS